MRGRVTYYERMTMKEAIERIDELLTPQHFLRHKAVWNRTDGSFVDVIDLQKSKSGDTFTIEAGVFHRKSTAHVGTGRCLRSFKDWIVSFACAWVSSSMAKTSGGCSTMPKVLQMLSKRLARMSFHSSTACIRSRLWSNS